MTVPLPAASSRSRAGGSPPVGIRRRLAGPQENNIWFWVFVGPFVLGLVVFVAVPILWSLYLSFFEARNTVTPTDFVGLGQLPGHARDPDFRSSLTTFVAFAAFIVPLTFACALALALLVNHVRVAQAFFRSVFFVPVACSYVVASMIWKMSIFNGVRFGLANTLLRAVGADGRQWLSRPHPPLYWVVIVSERLWLQVGFYMLLFLAGLQRIPQSLYEAAAVDGARAGLADVPLHHPSRSSGPPRPRCCVLLLINAFQAFDEFYNLLSNPGAGTYPPYARPPLVYLYYIALGRSRTSATAAPARCILTS